MPAAIPLTTSALCQRSGVTRGMLRVYEREGLLPPPARLQSGYRDYPPDTPARLEAIRQLKEVGFTLREIALLLAESASGGLTPARLRKLARQQLSAIDQRIARLQVVRDYVAAVAAGNMAALDDPACDFLINFLAAGAAPATPSTGRRQPALET